VGCVRRVVHHVRVLSVRDDYITFDYVLCVVGAYVLTTHTQHIQHIDRAGGILCPVCVCTQTHRHTLRTQHTGQRTDTHRTDTDEAGQTAHRADDASTAQDRGPHPLSCLHWHTAQGRQHRAGQTHRHRLAHSTNQQCTPCL